MKLNSLILILISPLLCFSQKMTVDRPDDTFEPDPFTKAYYADPNTYNKIATITTISKVKSNGFNPDTLNIRYFNEKGLKIKEQRFENNVPSKTTIFRYYPNDELLSWEMLDSKYSTMTYYYYSPERKIIRTRQLRVKQTNGRADSTLLNTISYKYNGGYLIEVNNSTAPLENFVFSENLLMFKQGGYIAKSFEYDENANLIEMKEFMGGKIVDSMIMGISTYHYDNFNRLLADSILTSSNLLDKKYQVTFYGYSKMDNNLLEKIDVSYEGLYRNIKLEYQQDKLKTVFVSTNGSNSAYLRMWLNHTIGDYYSFPIAYKEEFDYDTFGNRVAKKAYVNEELFFEIEYLITYKK